MAVIVIAGWVGVRAGEQGTVPYVALAVLLFLVVAAAVVMSGIYVVALVARFSDSDSTGT